VEQTVGSLSYLLHTPEFTSWLWRQTTGLIALNPIQT